MHLSRQTRRDVMRLAVAVIATWCAVSAYHTCRREPASDVLLSTPDSAEVLAHILMSDSLSATARSTGAGHTAHRSAIAADAFPFDPNTADSLTLLRLGLSPRMVRSIYNYRAHHGRYHRPEDFRRVPGMTHELYDRLAPHIRISRAFRYFDDAELYPSDSSLLPPPRHRDSISYPSQEKFREMRALDLNSVDTATLKQVPGIASVRARQIVAYREQLGGYVSPLQLLEIEGFPPPLLDWFVADSSLVARLSLATATERELGRHPYIGYARARAIVTYRRNYGRITSLQQLCLLPEFSADDIARMEPYVSY